MIRLCLAQLDPTLGDLPGNQGKIVAARDQAKAMGADLLVTSELALIGYPPEDLVKKPAFLKAAQAHLESLAQATADGGPAMLVGAPWAEDGKLYNAALLLEDGKIAQAVRKVHLPNYGVFDEMRVFDAASLQEPIPFKGLKLGVLICEDMWYADVAAHLKAQGADILIVPNGSPFELDKPGLRVAHAKARVGETGLALVYVNQMGGQDELVFDGASFALGRDATLKLQAPFWQEAVLPCDIQAGGDVAVGKIVSPPDDMCAIYQAMMVGLRDYVQKNRFPGVILGLSGGIDSALTAAVAADALGPDKVHTVMMPSPYTSQESLEDAKACADLLGIGYDMVGIEPAMQAFGQMLAPVFVGKSADITEENIQARSRGLLLMAISNKLGLMLLTTGNKSEMSVGYATLYGDMCGGYSVLKDVYKMTVFALCRWRNANQPEGALGPAGPVMPERIITKPPSAELKPNQTDQDSLPPYEVLDGILQGLVENEATVESLAQKGYDEATVKRVARMLDLAEYKRRQAPPGVKITSRAFGRDRRYPITNAFRP
ncbi:MAG: NAD+ synthase [Alphaproteobacteria bacterium]|nr:NAD+ synthase [Alphaproteobacteria bacterium]